MCEEFDEFVEPVLEFETACDFDEHLVDEDFARDVEECFVLEDFLELCFRLRGHASAKQILFSLAY